jgi:hypothetical protein
MSEECQQTGGMGVVRVVSGGQTGADRAALDAAIALGLEYGGWCPAGGWAEDLTEPPGLLARYPRLHEAPSAEPSVRTWLNVRDSDATLVVRLTATPTPGTAHTLESARELGRPYLVTHGDRDAVLAWLRELVRELGEEITLNVAGPRESLEPGVYAVTRSLLDDVLTVGP